MREGGREGGEKRDRDTEREGWGRGSEKRAKAVISCRQDGLSVSLLAVTV